MASDWQVSNSSMLESRIAELTEGMAQSPEVQFTANFVYACTLSTLGSRGVWARGPRQGATPGWAPVAGAGDWLNWDSNVWRGANILPGDKKALVFIAPNGRDERLVREFDLERGRGEAAGFNANLYRGGSISWIDEDTTLISRCDPSAGSSEVQQWVTRVWRRGQELSQADTIDIATARALRTSALGLRGTEFLVREQLSWGVSRFRHIRIDRPPSELEVPLAARVWVSSQLTVILSDRRTEIGGLMPPVGSLFAVRTSALVDGCDSTSWVLVYPGRLGERVDSVAVHGRLVFFSIWQPLGSKFRRFALDEGCTEVGADLIDSSTVSCMLAAAGDGIVVHREGFLEARSVFSFDVHGGGMSPVGPPAIRASAVEGSTILRWAMARDGVAVPYYAIAGKGRATFAIVCVYGGFGAVDRPAFDPGVVAGCVEGQGVYVLACVRGSGTLGPEWHEAGRGAKKLVASTDVLDVTAAIQAEYGIPPHRIGLIGGSNGALVLWNAITLANCRFGAAVLQVPLLDVSSLKGHQRAWIEEYSDEYGGEEWLRRISPLRSRLPPLSQIPPMLLVTSPNDDRVGEEQARQFAESLTRHGASVRHRSVLGGHRATLFSDVVVASSVSYGFLREHVG